MQMKVAVSGGIALGIIALGVALYFGWTQLHAVMFKNNAQYTIREIRVEAGRLTTKDELLKLIKIREGDNLFSFKASAIRKNILSNVKNIRDIRIRKVLPDTVIVSAEDREPVLRLGDTHFVADREGVVFILTNAHKNILNGLPVLRSDDRRADVSAGAAVTEPKTLAILDLVNAFNRLENRNFNIYGFDPTGSNYLIVQIDGYKEALFMWEEIMPAETRKERLRQGLENLRKTLSESSSATKIKFIVRTKDAKVHAE